MKNLILLSAPEQVAAHLRREILRGAFRGGVPGYRALSGELGVNHKTVRAALGLLEKQGLLVPQGAGRRSRVVLPENAHASGLRVKLLLFDLGDCRNREILDLMDHLYKAGHVPEIAARSLWCLKMDVGRVARFVAQSPADAWVILAGSKEVLQWFSEQSFPSFALMGRMRGVRIPAAKPDKIPAQREAVRRLVALGHRRIVKLVFEERVRPSLGLLEQSFLNDLEAAGIQTGSYNLCTWNGQPADLYQRLDALFKHTPPTAFLLDAVALLYAARDHLARNGIFAPDHVSLICYDPDPPFAWFQPSVAHIDWSFEPLVRRVVRWLQDVASGEEDYRQTFTKATFVDGGSVGPVPVGKPRR